MNIGNQTAFHSHRLRSIETIFRIGIVLFVVELLIMLVLPDLSGDDGIGTLVATLEDSLLLAVISTPLNIKWSLRRYVEQEWSPPYGALLGDGLLNMWVAIFTVIFSIECGIMLLIPLAGYEDGSVALALLDAGSLALCASPVVFLIVTRHVGNKFSIDRKKAQSLKRQFLLLFLPMLLLFSLAVGALYFQEIQSRHKSREQRDVRLLALARKDLLKELDYVVADMLVLAHGADVLEFMTEEARSASRLVRSLSGFLQVKNHFHSAFLVDAQGQTRVHLTLRNGEVLDTTRNFFWKHAGDTFNPLHLSRNEVVISGPLLLTDHRPGELVLRFGTSVVDAQGVIRGAFFLDFDWSSLEAVFQQLSTSLAGRFQFFSDKKRFLYPDAATHDGEAFMEESLWNTLLLAESGSVNHEGQTVLFTTLHYGSHFEAKQSVHKETHDHVHHLHAPTWKMLSWHMSDKVDPELIASRKRLLIFQSLLVGVAVIGSWFLSQAIIHRREASARNEQMHQSQILLNSLLETTLKPLTLEEQLREVMRIVSCMPWIGLTGKGALFLADPELKQMNLVAHEQLSVQEQKRVQKVSALRCLCQQAESGRSVLRFPNDAPGHVVCFQGDTHSGSYCIPIQGADGLIGMISLQLQAGYAGEDEKAFLLTLAGSVSGIIERRRIESALQSKQEELKQTRLDIIHRLGMAAEFRDQDTGQHVVRMSKYAALLARAAGLSEEEYDNLINAAPLHDVGKIGIPDHILLKPGSLDVDEWNTMKNHTTIGAMMLHGYEVEPMNTAHIIALTHHERWDGRGYPIGVPGEEIPIEGRICAIADVFDALTSNRPYKKAWSVEDAVQEIRNGAGSAFDPRLVEIFCNILPDIIRIKESCRDY